MTHAPSEREAVANKRRDEWAALYDQNSVRVWRYVASMIGADSSAVGDAVQETFLAAAKAFDQFDPQRGTVWSWLTGIAHRQVALYWRRRGRERIEARPVVEEALSDADPVFGVMQKETAEIVRRVLAELPAESAALLQGKYCDGLSVAELVVQVGGTTEAVRSRLARARRDFRSRFEEYGSPRNRENDGGPQEAPSLERRSKTTGDQNG